MRKRVFLFSRYLFLHSYVRIRYIDDVSVLIIANFVVWSWVLEEHPKLKTNPIIIIG